MTDLFLRTVTLKLGDAGQVTGRIAPFDEVVTVTDAHPDTGEVGRFREVFRHGAFQRMIHGLAARGWTGAVSLNIDHRGGVSDTIGYATAIEERADGAWATFALYDGDPQLDKIKSMLRTSHSGMSVGFKDLKHRVVDGVVERLSVHLDHVAVTPTPAYGGAGIASVRTDELANLPDLPTPLLDAAKAELLILQTSTPQRAPRT